MNVLLENRIGGPQNRVVSVGKKLKKYGIDTIILCPIEKGDFSQYARNENFKVCQTYIRGPRYLTKLVANLRWFFELPISVVKIVQIIKREDIDIVHVNGLLSVQAPIAALITKRKIVWHLMSSLYPRIAVMILMPFIVRISDRIIVISEKLGEFYVGKRLRKIRNLSIIYEPVDVERFDIVNVLEEDIKCLKEEFKIETDCYIVGCIGNISPIKGYEYLIESANIVRKKLSNNIKFIIVGDISHLQNDYYSKLTSMINSLDLNNHVIFTNKRSDIPQMLAMFDILVSSSIAEGTPLVILEAMSMKRPVCATDVGGIREQIYDCGILITPRDINEMADAIIFLINNHNERIEIGKKGREKVEKIFSLDECVNKHKGLYENISS